MDCSQIEREILAGFLSNLSFNLKKRKSFLDFAFLLLELGTQSLQKNLELKAKTLANSHLDPERESRTRNHG